MDAHTLFCDFASLSRKNAGDWVSNCSKLADKAFKNSSNQTRLLGNLLVLEQYMHTLEQGLQENGEEPLPITYQSIQMLWDYLDGKIKPSDFADFANALYACVLELSLIHIFLFMRLSLLLKSSIINMFYLMVFPTLKRYWS